MRTLDLAGKLQQVMELKRAAFRKVQDGILRKRPASNLCNGKVNRFNVWRGQSPSSHGTAVRKP